MFATEFIEMTDMESPYCRIQAEEQEEGRSTLPASASNANQDSSGDRLYSSTGVVVKIFILSVSYTAVWLAIGSQLSYLRLTYGPRVFLHINIAYYAPSIPLLLLESVFNGMVEARNGVASSILMRGTVGLCGYGMLTFLFPYIPDDSQTFLLWLVAGIGMCSSLAFSASYQLGARFTSVAVVALGMGGSASGPLVLVLELLFGIGAHPSFDQFLVLFSLLTILAAAGIWCLASLLMPHWEEVNESVDVHDKDKAIDQYDDQIPLIGDETRSVPILGRRDRTASVLAYNSLEPHSQPFIAAGKDAWYPVAHTVSLSTLTSYDFSNIIAQFSKRFDESGSDEEENTSGPRLCDANQQEEENGIASIYGQGHQTTTAPWYEDVRDTIACIWPCLLAMLIQCSTSLVVLPFFTYASSSGIVGTHRLPKYLFFSRLLGDLFGRWLPRVRYFAPEHQLSILGISLIKIIGTPLYFVYILQDSIQVHLPQNDVILVGFVIFMWLISGYVNSASNILAPQIVSDPHLKSTAAGLMALTYQVGHFLGLAVASVVSYSLFT